MADTGWMRPDAILVDRIDNNGSTASNIGTIDSRRSVYITDDTEGIAHEADNSTKNNFSNADFVFAFPWRNIPEGSTIDGIEVRVRCKITTSLAATITNCRFINYTSVLGNVWSMTEEKSSIPLIGTAIQDVDFGGTTDDWNFHHGANYETQRDGGVTSWYELTSSLLGITVEVDDGETFSLYEVECRVTYTAPTGADLDFPCRIIGTTYAKDEAPSGSTLTINYPSGIAADDKAVIFVTAFDTVDTTPSVQTPSGYSIFYSANTGGTYATRTAFNKTLTGSEGASETITFDATYDKYMATMIVVRNADNVAFKGGGIVAGTSAPRGFSNASADNYTDTASGTREPGELEVYMAHMKDSIAVNKRHSLDLQNSYMNYFAPNDHQSCLLFYDSQHTAGGGDDLTPFVTVIHGASKWKDHNLSGYWNNAVDDLPEFDRSASNGAADDFITHIGIQFQKARDTGASAPAIHSADAATQSGTGPYNQTVNLPTLADGDLCIVFFHHDVVTGSGDYRPTAPAGWTLNLTFFNTNQGVAHGFMWRECDGTEGSTMVYTTINDMSGGPIVANGVVKVPAGDFQPGAWLLNSAKYGAAADPPRWASIAADPVDVPMDNPFYNVGPGRGDLSAEFMYIAALGRDLASTDHDGGLIYDNMTFGTSRGSSFLDTAVYTNHFAAQTWTSTNNRNAWDTFGSSHNFQLLGVSIRGKTTFSQQFTQAVNAAATGTASLTKQITKTLAATATGTATESRIYTWKRDFSVAASHVATMNKLAQRKLTLTATAVGTATVSQVRSFLKTLTATATGAATVSLTKSLSQLLQATAVGGATVELTNKALSMTLTATAVGGAAITRTTSRFKTLVATVTANATLTRARTILRTLSATATGTATLTDQKTLFRLLQASGVGSAALTDTKTLFRTLAANAVGGASLTNANTFRLTLVASGVGTPVISQGKTLFRTLEATATGSPGIARAEVWVLLPDADVSQGSWTNELDGSTLYTSIDEIEYDGSDFIKSSAEPSADQSEVSLSNPGAVDTAGSHKIWYTYYKNSWPNERIDLTVSLVQGTTVIASRTHTDISTTPEFAYFELSAGEVTALGGNYTDLRIRQEATLV